MANFSSEFYKRVSQVTKDHVDRQAAVREYQIGQYKRRVIVTAPADVTVNQTMDLQLTGTDTDADRTYNIYKINFVFEEAGGHDTGGADMTIEARTGFDDIGGGTGSLQDLLDKQNSNGAGDTGDASTADGFAQT